MTTERGNKGGAVVIVYGPLRIVEPIGEDGFIPLNFSLHGLGVRIEQEFCRIASLTVLGRPGTVNPIAVTLPRLQIGQISVPAEAAHFGKVHACLFPVLIEKTEFNFFSNLGKD